MVLRRRRRVGLLLLLLLVVVSLGIVVKVLIGVVGLLVTVRRIVLPSRLRYQLVLKEGGELRRF